MFVDSVTLSLSAGKGGNGVIAWRREKFIPKGGPTGGNGGRGGSVLVQADKNVVSLEDYRNKRILVAQNGAAGGSNRCQGKSGSDLVLKVPCGTLVKDKVSQEILFDLTEDGQQVRLCKGGVGGKGNDHFKSPTHQAPNYCTEGTPGESKEVEFELKLIADVGLIGMPNAGKSTLLSKLAMIPVKIGAYPFTTLAPNLGYVAFSDGSRRLFADIPGIIEDAHANKGLGIAFLRHIERTSLLVFVIDISGFEERSPLDDYEVLHQELKAYDPKILEKPYVIALNKADMEESSLYIEEFQKRFHDHAPIYVISAKEGRDLSSLLEGILSSLTEVKL